MLGRMGGERTKGEICLYMFVYYPRLRNIYGCITFNSQESWKKIMNSSKPSLDYATLRKWLKELKWTSQSIIEWQKFYNDASRVVLTGRAGNFDFIDLPKLPEDEDLKLTECKRSISNSAIHQTTFILFTLISFCYNNNIKLF
ncbi:unnamed protein product [Rotaria sordida]|uniref:Uncharacterized protein n=1 Tax=Rotaria sordida TaxID=392033 RepID=A0A818RL41_9BILA|nr:unnamed protein product [Rotaria sordida]